MKKDEKVFLTDVTYSLLVLIVVVCFAVLSSHFVYRDNKTDEKTIQGDARSNKKLQREVSRN